MKHAHGSCCDIIQQSHTGLVADQADEERADGLHGPPAVVPGHPAGGALCRRRAGLQAHSVGRGRRRRVVLRRIGPRKENQPGRVGTRHRDGLGHGGGVGPRGRGRLEDHLRVVGGFLAHVRPEEPGALAGVAQLPQVPHDLDEEVARVLVVGAAGVRRAQVLAPVGPARAAAGDPQLGELAVAADQHLAQVVALGLELDGLGPDALAVARGHGGREEAAVAE